jgi:peptidoglycan hydrolase-like protein with peptidoglycan-binding domain
MNKIKFPKIILIAALLVISASLFSANTPTIKAATTEGVLAQIGQSQQQSTELQEKPAVWCHDFNTNLRIGDSGPEVTALQNALQKEGFLTEISGEFDEKTASAVVAFQEKYKGDILSPWGLEHGTGYVGKTTRVKLNALYGCGWCHDFNTNLRYGDRFGDIGYLQTALEKEGFKISDDEKMRNYFGDFTASAVVGFQEKYKGDILTPWGLEHGTGYVGKTTRAKLNELYGCGAIKPYITVISPNGGENWVVGNTYDIKWESKGIEKVKITLEVGVQQTIPTPIPVLIVDDYPANLGKYSWVVQNLPGKWKIRIAGKTADGSVVSDLSDDYFSIVSAGAPSITVTSPNGGEKWVVGNTYDITWRSSGIEKVNIYLEDTSVMATIPCAPGEKCAPPYLESAIATGISASSGKYSWTIPSNQTPKSTYRIRIADTNYSTTRIYNDSDSDFSIISTTTVEYEVNPYDADVKTCMDSAGKVWPATGEGSADWFVWGGCTHNKYYFVNPGQQLRLHAYTDSCPGCVCYFPNFYLYEYENGNWIQKKYFDLPDVKGITRDEYYTPSSNRIKIYAPSCFYLKVYSPQSVEIPAGYEVSNVRLNENGNSITVKPDQSISISLDYKIWSRTGCPGCIDQIVLGMDNKPLTCVYNGIPGIYPGKSGSYSGNITVPKTPGTYYLYTAYYTQYTCEDAMSIYPTEHYGKSLKIGTIVVTPEEKSITVISPNGGEKWVRGKTYDITWNSAGVDKVDIYARKIDPTIVCAPCIVGNYCPPCQGTLIAKNVSASLGKYSWTVPSDIALGDKYKIQIGDTGFYLGQNNIYDESDNYFSIVSP